MNLAQVLINSLITAAELGIIAVGLTLTFSLLKFANFAHVETAVAGGYLAWVFNVALGTNFALSTVIAVLVMGLVGILFDRAIFRVFRNMGDVAPMVASLGLAIAIRYTVQAVFGPRFLRYDFAIAPGEQIFGAFITRQQIWIVCHRRAGHGWPSICCCSTRPSGRRCARPRPTRSSPRRAASTPSA